MRPDRRSRVLFASVATAALVLALPGARAEVPDASPTFSNPLAITNRYFPVQPGAMKVYQGVDEGARLWALELHLHSTRTFVWNGVEVKTLVVLEIEFLGGQLDEASLNYFAQADDGSVWFFGETGETLDDGFHGDPGWLVGGPTLPSDPPGAGNATAPSLVMPAHPEVGDQFLAENVPPDELELATVLSLTEPVSVGAGRFADAMSVRRLDLVDGEQEMEWHVQGLGVVRQHGRGEAAELVATTLQPSPGDGSE